MIKLALHDLTIELFERDCIQNWKGIDNNKTFDNICF